MITCTVELPSNPAPKAAQCGCAGHRAGQAEGGAGMTRQPNRSDLRTLEAVDKKLAVIRNALKTVTELDGINDALAIADQLEEAITDIAADVEMELHDRNAQKGR